jgi:hypothetical protein
MGTTSSHEIDNSRSSSKLYWPFHSESMKKKRFICNIGPKIATSKNAFSFLARL